MQTQMSKDENVDLSNNYWDTYYLHNSWINECKIEFKKLAAKTKTNDDLITLETQWLSSNPPLIRKQQPYCIT